MNTKATPVPGKRPNLTPRRMLVVPAAVAAAVTLSLPAHADAASSQSATVAAASVPAVSVSAVSVSAASLSAAGRIPGRYCGQAKGSGGYVRQAAPWRSGAYIRVSSIIHCGKADMWSFRSMETHLSQYRGLGIWSAKARKITRKNGRAAYTVTHNLSWKCSGGSQLYRTTTANRVGRWLFKTYSGQRRFSC
ncbi:hypothetical protein ABZ897_58800 [Nonomuraea sp. NPDC046802]|uniref:hypothetical protein n=1 Tax=Nonomuraea sp. NPDC046802 TaxID=3154919 RepID=UPI0033CA9B6E